MSAVTRSVCVKRAGAEHLQDRSTAESQMKCMMLSVKRVRKDTKMVKMMADADRRYRTLAMAMKAGGIAAGGFAAGEAIRRGKAHAVVIARDASKNTKKKYSNSCEYYGVWYTFFGEKEKLGRCIGKEERSVLAVTNESLAGAFKEQTGRNDVDGED